MTSTPPERDDRPVAPDRTIGHGPADVRTTRSAPSDPLFAIGRAILFELDPERAHDLALALLDRPSVQRLMRRRYAVDGRPVERLGLRFPNPVGLAAGLDKNGDHIDALGALGFGALEIGTVTPRPQPGNPVPRLFRLTAHGALINRFGFNNKGVDHLVRQVERRRWRGPLGINVGKNAATPIERATDDYVACLERVYPHADWVTVNISSPNTANLRALQHGDALERLLARLKETQASLATRHGRHVPIAVKIAPDLDDAGLDAFCGAVTAHDVEAVISGNTTNAREGVRGHLYARETGGLSGAPLKPLADARLAALAERLAGTDVTLIGVGGVSRGADVATKLALGAHLVQLYTGLIFHGPALIRDGVRASARPPAGDDIAPNSPERPASDPAIPSTENASA